MVLAAATSLLVLLAFAASPLWVYVVGRRRPDGVMAQRRATVVIYCTYILVCFGMLAVSLAAEYRLIGGRRTELVEFFGAVGSVGLGCLSLAGPFIAADLWAWGKLVRSKYCKHCGYDLTGNLSGICSECGADAAEATTSYPDRRTRLQVLSWRRFFLLYLTGVALLFIALGYAELTRAFICSECGRHESREAHGFGLPFVDTVLLEVGGRTVPWPNRYDCLTPYLDPAGTCQHNWVGLGRDREGWTGVARGIGSDPSYASVADEPDFSRFVAEHPDVLDRIRADLRQRRSVKGWLSDEYLEWAGQSP